jgi:hypothetical protein
MFLATAARRPVPVRLDPQEAIVKVGNFRSRWTRLSLARPPVSASTAGSRWTPAIQISSTAGIIFNSSALSMPGSMNS